MKTSKMSSQSSFGSKMRPLQPPKPGRLHVRPSAPVRPLHLWKALSSSFLIQMLSLRTFSASTLHKHFRNVLTIIIWIQNEALTASQTWSSACPPIRPCPTTPPLEGPIKLIFDPNAEFEDIFSIYTSYALPKCPHNYHLDPK